jgi:predicted AAA+ superfamily ATPase
MVAIVDRDLQTIVLSDNPWIQDPSRLQSWLDAEVAPGYVERLQAPDVRRWSDPRRAHLVIGPRQAGKSSLLRRWLSVRGGPALVLDCEQALIREWCRSAPLFLTELRDLVPVLPAILLEEAQHLTEAGLFVKGLIDRRYPEPILVTGSSSWQLGARTRESLAGRATRTLLLPFSLEEVAADAATQPPLLAVRTRQERFERHVRIGGYPDVWRSDDPRTLLTDLVEAFVIRDASDLFHIERPEAFRGLLHLAARQVGSLVNLSEWGALLGINHATVSSYLSLLEESHVVRLVRPFAGGKRSELTSRPKAFFLDVGLRNHLAADLRGLDERVDAGAVLENWVFTELAKALPLDRSIHFWRSTSGAEVDFVLRGGSSLVAVEVKAARLGRPKLPRAARSFIGAYSPHTLLVVNRGVEAEEDVDGCRVRWIHPTGLAAALRGTPATG